MFNIKKIFILLIIYQPLLFVSCMTDSFHNTDLSYDIVNLSDSSIIINYSFYSSNLPGKAGYYDIDKKKEIVLSKDSLIIGPFPVRKTIDHVSEFSIGDIIDDTIFIEKKDSTSIKRDIYNLSNWNYFYQKKSKYWKFLYKDKLKYREYDKCTMRFVITNKDL